MSEDRFLDSLRADAKELRYEPSDVALTRLSARIRGRLAQPTVRDLLAAWLRPLAVSVGAVAVVASVGLAFVDTSDLSPDQVEISMAGDVYSVGH